MRKLRTAAAQELAELGSRAAEGQRLARGRRYQRDGLVADLDVGPGWVSAVVAGSRAEPYSVSIACKAANENERQAARIDVAGAVPRPLDVAFTCICPDWGDPCKHGIAVLLEFAHEVDDDPRLLLSWRVLDDVELPARQGTESLDVHAPSSLPAAKRSAAAKVRQQLGSGLTTAADLTGPAQPTVLDEFFRGAMPAELSDILGPLDEVQADTYSRARIPLENVDAAPVVADALDTIASYWLGR